MRWRFRVNDPRLRTRVGQLELPNPVGLAAGFDKNCEMSSSLFNIGFGYLTLGTVTLNPREGNPKPRMWRYPQSSLVNSMGLPNEGADATAVSLTKHVRNDGPTIVSISGLTIEEFTKCFRKLEPQADGVELNISTPNTVGVRVFQQPDLLTNLLNEIKAARHTNRPVWVKIPPYFEDAQRENVHRLIDVCVQAGMDGLTATNTRLVDEPRASIGTGGLSGPLIFQDTLRIVADVYQYTNGRIPINACGGISSGLDAWRAFEAGASSVQLYTALVYEGPGVVSKINHQLIRMLETSKLHSLADLTGTGLR
jgi:dihydroorotate dehydrogenase